MQKGFISQHRNPHAHFTPFAPFTPRFKTCPNPLLDRPPSQGSLQLVHTIVVESSLLHRPVFCSTIHGTRNWSVLFPFPRLPSLSSLPELNSRPTLTRDNSTLFFLLIRRTPRSVARRENLGGAPLKPEGTPIVWGNLAVDSRDDTPAFRLVPRGAPYETSDWLCFVSLQSLAARQLLFDFLLPS